MRLMVRELRTLVAPTSDRASEWFYQCRRSLINDHYFPTTSNRDDTSHVSVDLVTPATKRHDETPLRAPPPAARARLCRFSPRGPGRRRWGAAPPPAAWRSERERCLRPRCEGRSIGSERDGAPRAAGLRSSGGEGRSGRAPHRLAGRPVPVSRVPASSRSRLGPRAPRLSVTVSGVPAL